MNQKLHTDLIPLNTVEGSRMRTITTKTQSVSYYSIPANENENKFKIRSEIIVGSDALTFACGLWGGGVWFGV